MNGIRKGERWEEPVPEGTVPTEVIRGDDGALARAVENWRGSDPLLQWEPTPTADLARALGIRAGQAPQGLALACDLLRASGAPAPAVNALTLGPFPPGRLAKSTDTIVEIDGRTVFHGPATTVVVASGEFLAGNDVFPTGHPGDGRAEVMVLGLAPGDRAAFRQRLTNANHIPHPDVTVASGTSIDITMDRAEKLVGDGGAWTVPDVRAVQIRVESGAFRLLV